MRRAAALIALLVASASAARAQAPDDKTKAEQLYAEGTRHFEKAEYAAAIASYEDAYRVVPDPLFLFNIGQVQRKAGDCAAARRFYRSYLQHAPTAYNRSKVEKHIVEMEACIRAAGGVPDPDPADAGDELRHSDLQECTDRRCAQCQRCFLEGPVDQLEAHRDGTHHVGQRDQDVADEQIDARIAHLGLREEL